MRSVAARLLVAVVLVLAAWTVHAALAVGALAALALWDMRLAAGTFVALLGVAALRFLDVLFMGESSAQVVGTVFVVVGAALAFFVIAFTIVRAPRGDPLVD